MSRSNLTIVLGLVVSVLFGAVGCEEDDDPSTRQAALVALAALEQREGVPYHLSAELRGKLAKAVGEEAPVPSRTMAVSSYQPSSKASVGTGSCAWPLASVSTRAQIAGAYRGEIL